MLQTLTIRNYALISELEIGFGSGFSVLTGETGAGKSIILGALSLILGQRADAKTIRRDAEKCLIEGVFDISSYNLEHIFTERNCEYDPKSCILRREIWANGKSRAFVNDSPASLSDLKEIGACLIDIHSQHQNLLLADNHFQMKVLDVLAKNRDLKNEYNVVFQKYLALNRQIDALKDENAKRRSEEDYIRFQFNQLEEAGLKKGEQAELEAEQQTLSHVEEIKTGLFRISQILQDNENSVVASLKEAANTALNLQKIYPPAEEIANRIRTAYIDLKDLAPEIETGQDALEYRPDRLQQVIERLDTIYSLEQKHRLESVEALIELRDSLGQKLGEIVHSDEIVEELEKQSAETWLQVETLAGKLSQTRKRAASDFQKQLIEKVKPLGMPNMTFSVDISPKSKPDATGKDEVVFLFSANKNGELRPVATTASGGEISRLMLGVKSLIAGAMSLPAIIFDEIDTGISGETADRMGIILNNMGKEMQVIAISHLPQIAARGNAQYLVYKEENKNSAETRIRQLTDRERITEIAKMLSGTNLTDAAIENAKVLLKN